MTILSILDLARITDNGDARTTLDNARDLAGCAETLGYRRFWLAEHHNMTGTASAATAVALAHVAAGTRSIRIGAGGVMLPNHAPIIIAEQYGTLARLFPGRVDLGVGRASGSDQYTMRALRRTAQAAATFPQDVLELQSYFQPLEANQLVQAVPAAGTEVPLWILGSSTYGAALAAELGLPYVFASHFAPDLLLHALDIYRSGFKPSAQLSQPYAMISVNVVAATSDAEACKLATTQQMAYTDILRGTLEFSKPPIADIDSYWSPAERAQANRMMACSVIGAPDTIRRGLAGLISQTKADELMIVSDVYEHQARLESVRLIAAAVSGRGFASPQLASVTKPLLHEAGLV